MICKERGVMPNSQYFFFTPSMQFLKYNYAVVNCGHFFCQYGYERSRKGNAYPLFLYIAKGEFHLDYNHTHFIAHKGEIVLINCAKPHTYYVENDCEFYYFHFAGKQAYEISDMLIEQNNSPIFFLSNTAVLFKQIKEKILSLCYDQPVSDTSLSCMAYECLCILQASGDVFTVEDSDHPISKSMNYIREHLNEKLSIEVLSHHVSLSPYYFAHTFKEYTGISPMEYVAITKIDYAKSMLKTTATSIANIASLLGYSSDASFINAFKKRTGISPARFRKEI